MKQVSVILPTRNEINHIKTCIDSIVSNTYPQDKIEILVIDGMSEDGTPDVVVEYAGKYSNIKLLHNQAKIVPTALNIGILAAAGDIIIRMDAHSIYPVNYISELVLSLNEYDADNVGGVWVTKPANNTPQAKAIAFASSSKFGVGDALYRTIVSNKQTPIETDTVPFGCYKKEVFSKIGMFDEELIRNQDDEFNARLIETGGKILLLPWLKIEYFSRSNFRQMTKMFYQYGLFKPLVNMKLKRPATLRQFVPVLFVMYLFFLLFQPLIYMPLTKYALLPILIYSILNVYVSFLSKGNSYNFKVKLIIPIAFFLIHFSYGVGYLNGIITFVILKKRSIFLKETR